MTYTAPQSDNRRTKSLSPDVLEILHMLSAIEKQPRRALPVSDKD
jgi:hypothetical protein